MKPKKIKAYICGTDWNHEIDPDNADPPEFFSSLARLKKERKCWRECGIVQVELSVKLLKRFK